MDQILDMARELGYAIQQDERFIRTQLAQAAAELLCGQSPLVQSICQFIQIYYL